MKRLACLALTIALAGCSLWPSPTEPSRKYTLGYTTAKSDVSAMKVHLLVDMPSVYPPLDTLRITLRPTERAIDYLADGEWANRLGSLIQESIVYSLQNSNKLASVSRPSEGIKVDKVLKIEVRGFEVDIFSQPPAKIAQVDYLVQIAEMPSRRVQAAQAFRARVNVTEENLDAYIKALNQAHLDATSKMIEWALKNMPKSVAGTDEAEAGEEKDTDSEDKDTEDNDADKDKEDGEDKDADKDGDESKEDDDAEK